MAISVNFPDKIIAGVNHSLTITTDEGPPKATLQVEATTLPCRLIPLGPPKSESDSDTPVMKYKVTFYLPDDAVGKSLQVDLWTEASRLEDARPVVAG